MHHFPPVADGEHKTTVGIELHDKLRGPSIASEPSEYPLKKWTSSGNQRTLLHF
jgi:hypothetical protein